MSRTCFVPHIELCDIKQKKEAGASFFTCNLLLFEQRLQLLFRQSNCLR